MLLDDKVKVVLNGGTDKYYEKLGYVIPRRKTKQYKMQTPLNVKLEVFVKDLPINSSVKVRVRCDSCEKELLMTYQAYNEYKKDIDTYYCNKCAKKIFNSGINHPNWREDISDEEREVKRSCLEYKDWTKRVLARDNYICQCCKKESNADMESHHLDGYNWCEEKRFDDTNGIALCQSCHKNFHSIYGYGDNTREQFEDWIGHTISLAKCNIDLPTRKKVYCLEENTIYDDVDAVAEHLGCVSGSVYSACNGVCNTLAEMHFLYYDEYKNMSQEDIKDFLNKKSDKRFKKIICLHDNNIFNSVTEASEYYKCDIRSINSCCKGKTTGVYIYNGEKVQFMYLDEYEKGVELKELIDYRIICLHDKKLFNNIREASRYYGCQEGSISRVCKGLQNHVSISINCDKKNIKAQFMFLKDYNSGKTLSPIKNDKDTVKIICVNHNNIFNSIKAAAEYYKCGISSISQCCREKSKFVNSINPNTLMEEKLQFMYLKSWTNGKVLEQIKEYSLICEYDSKVFNSPKEASLYYKCHINSIRNNCKNRTKSVLIKTQEGERVKTRFKYLNKQ
jgi:hypothetical protein